MRSIKLCLTSLMLTGAVSVSAQVQTSQLGAGTSPELIQMDTQKSPSLNTNGQNIKAGLDTGFLTENIQRAMDEAITDKDLPGGVVLITRHGQTAFFEAYGNRALIPAVEATTKDTIYDMASLTKSVATASSIMKLVEQGRIRLSDRIDKFIPEWKNTPEEASQAKLLDQFESAIDHGKITKDSGIFKATDSDSQNLLKYAFNTFSDLQSAKSIAKDFNLLPKDRESITIRHLLTHTSGLPSYVRYYEKYPEKGARKKIVGDIAKIDLRGTVGGQFVYSDLGFIVLGDIVERVSGMPLDQFSHKYIFDPLKMNDTMFNPPESLFSRIAPTAWRNLAKPADDGTTRAIIRGEVHDDNAWVQDGVSGHAGLFSTAEDMQRFCTMLLNGGSLDGVHIFSPVTVAAITSDHARQPEGGVKRGLGWDMDSPYDSPKGDLFKSGFGHTGYTGTSIWVVPDEDLAVIILTNRVHPNDTGSTVQLRAKIANIVAGSIVEPYKASTAEKNK